MLEESTTTAVGAVVFLVLTFGGSATSVSTREVVCSTETYRLGSRTLALFRGSEVCHPVRERLSATTFFAHFNSLRIVG